MAAASGVPGEASGPSRLQPGPVADAPPSLSAFPTEIQTQILCYLNAEELISLRASNCTYRDIVSNDCQETWKELHNARWSNGKRQLPTDFQAWSKAKGWSVHPEEIVDGNWYSEFVRRSILDHGVLERLRALDVEQSQGNDVWYGLMADGQDVFDSVLKISAEEGKIALDAILSHSDGPSLASTSLLKACRKVLVGINRCARYQEWKFLIDASTCAFPMERGVQLEEGAIAIANFYKVPAEPIFESWNYYDEYVNTELDKLATIVKERLLRRSIAQDYPIDEVLEEMKFLFDGPGPPNDQDVPTPFTGNVGDYYCHTNSLINFCLMSRKGIPMTLSIIYVAVVRRICGVEMDIIGLPGHIVVGAPSNGIDNASRIFVDPFHQGRILTLEDCRDIVARYNITFNEDMVRPIANRQVWERILRNLIHCHSQQAMAEDNGETTDAERQWKIVVPLRCFLSDFAPQVTSLRTLLAAPGWCPQYC